MLRPGEEWQRAVKQLSLNRVYYWVSFVSREKSIMKFITVRDLRGRSAEVWRQLAEEHELVVTSNGKPIAILTSTNEDTFEQSTREARRARALRAVGTLQQQSVKKGRERLTDEDIDAEIAEARSARHR